jgi:hypothetical protein
VTLERIILITLFFRQSLDHTVISSVVEPYHFYAASAPGKNFDAAPAPTLLYSKAAKFLKLIKV